MEAPIASETFILFLIDKRRNTFLPEVVIIINCAYFSTECVSVYLVLGEGIGKRMEKSTR